jgi:hypothetical protein
MDANRFDTIAKALRSETSRRRTLGGLLGGSLGLLGLVRPDASWALDKRFDRDCKKQCDQCEKCEKGKCSTRNGKKRCDDGKCKPRANGVACAACTGRTCTNGTCQRGRCVASAPPPPYCTGKNFCPTSGPTPFCNATAGNACICAVTVSGAPFCANANEEIETVASCNTCTATGRTCLNTSACGVAGEVSCVYPCPNPV